MKVITIHQPWASLIAYGFKRYETRSWKTNYRGLIAIHAGQKLDSEAVRMLATEYTRIWRDISPLPRGCIIAFAHLVDCWKVLDENHLMESQPPNKKRVKFLDSRELPFGDYTAGRYAWELAGICRIEPVPVKGKQGLWNWEGANANE